MSESQNLDDSELFRIMVATDNHMGYLENDQIRGDDSFQTFEEILQISKAENVDFLLLGGDLFHHHNPSKKTM
jgi:double-strand break repair protein MRE11